MTTASLGLRREKGAGIGLAPQSRTKYGITTSTVPTPMELKSSPHSRVAVSTPAYPLSRRTSGLSLGTCLLSSLASAKAAG